VKQGQERCPDRIQQTHGNYKEQIEEHCIQAEQVYTTELRGSDATEVASELNSTQIVVSKEQKITRQQLAINLDGSIEEVKPLLELILAELQKQSKDVSIKIVGVERGSIRLILEGSSEGLKRLEELFQSGKLTEVLGIPVEDIRLSNTPIKILLLTANPKGTTPLSLDEEVREINEGLLGARQQEQLKLVQRWAVRPRDVQRAMLDENPQIVHFSGHGAGEEGLVFEDETGKAKLVDGSALAGLFELFADQVNCVVLNGCYSEVQSKGIVKHIDYVIGMSQAIGARAAIEFAVGFYKALGAGRPIEFAYKLGCNAILAGIPEHLTPVLLKKSDAGDSVI